MIRNKLWIVSLSLLALPLAVEAGGFFGTKSVEDPVTQAHEAFLKKDYARMSSKIRSALQSSPRDPAVKENLFGLLRKTVAALGIESLPIDWSVPSELSNTRIVFRRFAQDSIKYTIAFQGDGPTETDSGIQKLQIIKYPDQVIADRETGVGEWYSKLDQGANSTFELKSTPSMTRPETGLYLLNIGLKNGKQVDGWFIVDDESFSGESPELLSPANGEVTSNPTPVIQWKDFKSSHYKPFEKRAMSVVIATNNPPQYEWNPKWELHLSSPDLTEATVGSTEGATGVSRLEKGRYRTMISFREQRSFGNMRLIRNSIVTHPFTVK